MTPPDSPVKERWVIQHINEWESPHYYVEGAPLTTNSDNATSFTKEQAEALVKTEDFVECRRGIYVAVWCPLTAKASGIRHMNSPTPPPSPATPTLAEQIAYMDELVKTHGFPGDWLSSEARAVERAILASLEQLASLQSRLAEVERDAARRADLLKDATHRIRWILQYLKDIDVGLIEDELQDFDAALSAASVDGDKGEGK